MSNIKIITDGFGRPKPVKEEELFEYGLDVTGQPIGPEPLPQEIFSTTVDIPWETYKNMKTSPVTIVDAPGEGKYVDIISIFALQDIITPADTDNNYPQIVYNDYEIPMGNEFYVQIGHNTNHAAGRYFNKSSVTGGVQVGYGFWTNSNAYNHENLPVRCSLDADISEEAEITLKVSVVYQIIDI